MAMLFQVFDDLIFIRFVIIFSINLKLDLSHKN